jgi:hypothetical protein
MAASARDFSPHDWEGDAEWARFLRSVELPAQPAAEAASLRRLKRRYWLRFVDPSAQLPPEGGAENVEGPPGGRAENGTSAGPEQASSRPAAAASISSIGRGVDLLANLAIVGCAIALLLSGSPSAYQWLLLAACTTCIIHLYRSLGAPRFSQEYLIRMLANDSTHYLLLSLALLNDFPVLLFVPVVTIYALVNIAIFASTTAFASLPMGLGRYVRSLTEYILTKREQFYFTAAWLEVLLLPLIIIKCFQGYVSLISSVVCWQFITARYRSNLRVRTVVSRLLEQLDAIVYSYLPSVIVAPYQRLRGG